MLLYIWVLSIMPRPAQNISVPSPVYIRYLLYVFLHVPCASYSGHDVCVLGIAAKLSPKSQVSTAYVYPSFSSYFYP